MTQARHTCSWTHDADISAWSTGCGHTFQFNNGGPEENDQKFCGYCGGELVVVAEAARREAVELGPCRDGKPHIFNGQAKCIRCLAPDPDAPPPPADDLVKRLRSPMRHYAGHADLCNEAAAAIEALRAERRVVEEALLAAKHCRQYGTVPLDELMAAVEKLERAKGGANG